MDKKRNIAKLIFLTSLVSAFLTVFVISIYEPYAVRRWLGNILPGCSNAAVSLDTDETVEFTEEELTNINVYENTNKGVVNISTIITQWNNFMRPVQREGESGSGVVLDDEGYILTNFHVIQNASSRRQTDLFVTLWNKSKYEGRIVGYDQPNDLAVIKIDADPEELFPITIGDSSQCKVGQKVYAIGNPFGLDRTLTVGVVSSLGRTIQIDDNVQIEDVIQHDAPVNPGNSGGPLLDNKGNLIGINTTIFSTSGGSIGIHFAISSQTIKLVIEDLIEFGRVNRPQLGIRSFPIEDVHGLADYLNLPVSYGVMVVQVYSGSNAQRAGLEGARGEVVRYLMTLIPVDGDVILEIDGRAIHKYSDITLALKNKRPGDTADLKIFRDGQLYELEMSLR